jgi:hypothetical protein
VAPLQKNNTLSLVIPQLLPLAYPSDANWGVDAMKVSIPISGEMSLPLPQHWKEKSGRPLKDGSENIYYQAEFVLGLYKMMAFFWVTSSRCTIDFNPAHSVFGNNELLLPVEALPRILQSAIEATGLAPTFEKVDELGTLVWDQNWLEQVNVQELELARNIFVPKEAAKAFEKGLLALPTPRGYKRKHEQKSGSFTLEFSTGSVGKDIIYNKTAQMKALGLQPKEFTEHITYRYETRLRSKRLEKHDLKRPDDIRPENSWLAISDRFSKCGFQRELSGGGEILAKISRLSYRERERILGFSQLFALGLDQDLAQGARRERLKAAAELGLTLGMSLDDLSEASWAIDLWTGFVRTIEGSSSN